MSEVTQHQIYSIKLMQEANFDLLYSIALELEVPKGSIEQANKLLKRGQEVFFKED